MNVPNLNQESLQQILPRVQELYPGAIIKKPLLGPETMQVEYESILFIVRKRKNDFAIDFDISKRVAIAVAFGALGVLIAKSIFKSKNKVTIENFQNSFIDIVNGIGKE